MARRYSRHDRFSPAAPAAGGADIAARLHELEHQIGALMQAQPGVAAPPHYQAGAAGHGPLTHRLGAVTGHVGAPETYNHDDHGDTHELAQIEHVLRDLSGRIELSEQRNADALASIQTRISDLGATAAQAEHPRMHSSAATLTDVKNRLAALSSDTSQIRTDRADARPRKRPRRASAVQDAPVKPAPPKSGLLPAAGPETDEDFQNLGRRLQQIRARASTQTPPDGGSDIAALSADMRALATDVEQLRRDTIPESDLNGLREDIARLSQRVEENDPWSQPDNPITSIETRIDDLTRQIEQSLTTSDLSPQIVELDQRVSEIAHQMSAAAQSQDDSADYDALEQQIGLLAGRLESAEQGFSSLQQIEANVARLFSDMETNREFAAQSAKEAAANATALVDRGAGDDPLPDDTLAMLQAGLKTVQENAQQADTRTQKTLEAVHDTLKTVIERLASLEQSGSTTTQKSVAEGSESEPVTGTGSTEIDSLRLPPIDTPKPEAGARQPEPATVRSAGTIRPGADETSGDEVQSRPEKEPNRVTRNEDFIAAARRAARISNDAAPEDSNVSAAGGLMARAQKLRLGKNRSGAADRPTQQTGDKKPGTQRRTLLMAAVVLLMIGTASTYSLLGSKSGKPLPGGTKPATTGKSVDPAADKQRGGAKVTPSQATPPVATIAVPKATAPKFASEPSGSGDRQRTAKTGPDPMLPADIETVTRSLPSRGAGKRAPALGPANPVSGMGRSLLTPSYIGEIPVSVPESAARRATSGKSDKAPAKDDQLSTGSIQRPSPLAANMPPAAIGPQVLREAAAGGNAIAQFEVAGRYIEGKYVAQDFRKAARWYQRAAAQGLAPAQYRLGTLYEKGHGVPRDVASARIWYERAAEKGNRKAMHNLAVIYAQKSGGKPNFAKAAAWFRRAAEHGLTDSQYNLGILHERGYGVKVDAAEAYKWFSLAAKNGDKDAASRQTYLEKTMDAQALATARLRVGAWQPKPLKKSANSVTLPSASWHAAPAGKSVSSSGSAALKEVQSRLNALGYTPGSADGLMGKKTRSAIRLFQGRNGMAVNGTVTPQLLERLRAVSG